MCNEIFSWPSTIRDTTEFPSINISVNQEIRPHLDRFCSLDGANWNEIAADNLGISDSRVRTYRKLYERLGILYKDNDRVRVSRLGRDIHDLEHNVINAKEELIHQIRVSAIDILARYQLRNPIDGPNLPATCDVLPYVCIWQAMRNLEDRINYEEMNRVILHIASMSELGSAIERISNARSLTNNYSELTAEQYETLLGPQALNDQASARIAPWFSLTGWGGLIIEQNNDSEGFRRLVPAAIEAIDNRLADIPPYFEATTADEWLNYYIGNNVDSRESNSSTMIPHSDSSNRVIGGTNIILYGVPGSGKSRTIKDKYCDDENRMERVVFHPDYTHSDFVGQILPKIEKTHEGDQEKTHIEYEFSPGPFTRILAKACDESNQDKDYYLVIEEINRGNAPAIFGDIFQLLDRDETGCSEYGISNASIADYVYKDKTRKVRIPGNLFILATMNTSDQNVFTLDTAFKRRWTMEMIENNIDKCLYADMEICNSGVKWGIFVKEINDVIAAHSENQQSNEDHRLGAYFARPEELSDSKRFSEKVLMYLWDDVFKFDRDKIFKSEYRTLDELIKAFILDGFAVFNDENIHFDYHADTADSIDKSEVPTIEQNTERQVPEGVIE